MIEYHQHIVRPHGRDLTDDELVAVATQFAVRPELWTEHVSHDPGRRTYAQLLRDEHLDVWLLCWSRDHDTGFHDHDLSAGAVAVAAGSVREDRLVLGRPVDAPISRVASARYRVQLHRLRHPPRAARGRRPGGDDPRLLTAAAADGELYGRAERPAPPPRRDL
ncbi:MAG TPA: hypothetical protein VGI17_00370 [Solirubrobacterales bacterium]